MVKKEEVRFHFWYRGIRVKMMRNEKGREEKKWREDNGGDARKGWVIWGWGRVGRGVER